MPRYNEGKIDSRGASQWREENHETSPRRRRAARNDDGDRQDTAEGLRNPKEIHYERRLVE